MTAMPSVLVSRRTGSFKSHDGTEIYYEIRGEGSPTIWVYGIACLMNHWHHQLTHFSHRHQVISFDLRGHNRSQIPSDLGQMTVKAMARDLIALMDHLEIPQAHLMGHSFGVPVLIEFASLAPGRALSYTFINGFAKNPIQGMFGSDMVEKFFHLAKGVYRQFPELWKPFWKLTVQNPLSFILTGAMGGFNLQHTEWKDIEIYARGIAQMSLDMFIPLFEDMMRFNGQSSVTKITEPTLVLAGAKDFVTPLSFQKELHEQIPGSLYQVLEQGSHCTQLDFPEQVNRAIEGLISRQEAEGRPDPLPSEA